MSAPTVTILYNNSQNNLANTGGASGDSNWEVLDCVNDSISFQGAETEDEDPTTSKSVFVIPDSGSQEVPRQFVNDYSEGTWNRIFLGGSDADEGVGGSYRYAYCAYINGATSSVPILQAWDDEDCDSYDLEVLGSGTPADSMLKAIVTTNSAPGAEWAGTPLAGSGGSNSLELDTDALSVAKNLYWNMRLLVPYTANSFTVNPILCIYLTYS
jgi:hypothetical protein